MALPETIAAMLTPTGRGAVAVVVVEGPQAARLVSERFHSTGVSSGMSTGVHATSGNRATLAVNQIRFGRWRFAAGEEVVVCRRSDERFELHCHGGRQASQAILDELAQSGVRCTNWRDWQAQSLQGDFAVAAAAALAGVRTERAALVLLDQLSGALGRRWRELEQLIAERQLRPAQQLIARLVAHAPLGLHLISGWQVTLAGRPNVGKSSLVNALLGYERTIVFDQPGTTRDSVSTTTALSGWPVQLNDTAGLRDADDALEVAGVERTAAKAATADVLVLVLEAGQLTAEDDALLEAWPDALVVLNKCDLVDGEAAALAPLRECVRTIAPAAKGIDALAAAIVDRLVPNPPAAGEAVVFATAQLQALQLALKLMRSGKWYAAAQSLAEVRQHAST